MMRGRDLFHAARPVLLVAEWLLRALPRFVVERCWWLVAWVPGYVGVALRYVFARRLCRRCGVNVYIGSSVEIRSWRHLAIGNNVTIHRFYWIDAVGGVDIHDDVRLAHSGSILSFEHSWEQADERMSDQALALAAVRIGPDVILGAGVRVLAGAQILERVVVGANAVVTRKQALRRGIYAGAPAKRIKALESSVPYAGPGEDDYSGGEVTAEPGS